MLLELKGIQKTFGGVQALSDGNLSVAAGEAHLLLGENGAGKSTLMKIVAGMHERDAGQMLWEGREVRLTTPAQAAAIVRAPQPPSQARLPGNIHGISRVCVNEKIISSTS